MRRGFSLARKSIWNKNLGSCARMQICLAILASRLTYLDQVGILGSECCMENVCGIALVSLERFHSSINFQHPLLALKTKSHHSVYALCSIRQPNRIKMLEEILINLKTISTATLSISERLSALDNGIGGLCAGSVVLKGHRTVRMNSEVQAVRFSCLKK